MSLLNRILPRRSRAIQALLVIAAVALAACETTGVRDAPGDLQARAEAQTAAGNHAAAARLYERLAGRASGEQRDRSLVAAAEAWYFAGERNRALHAMRSSRRPWPTPLSAVQSVLAAAIEVDDGAPRDALARLRELPPDPSRSVASDALAVGASAWFRLADPVRAVEALIEREVWLDSPQRLLANQRRIWEGLRSAGQVAVPEDADPVLAGWLELGNAITERAGDPLAERAALLRWRDAYPDHPGSDILVRELLAEYGEIARMPERVALLLPLSDRLASAGQALRDGFLAAYFEYSEAAAGTDIAVYDTAALGAESAYRQAVAEGANFVVGPLVKDEVEQIAALTPAGPPTLALNYLPGPDAGAINLFQFAIAPEHEARRIGQRAVAEGLYRAVAIVPGNNWGQRIVDAFADELEARGGTLLTHEVFEPAATDFSAVIQPALHLDRSHARHRALVAATGRPMEFEPRRRQDVDFVFFAAQATQARLIRPQLRFHYAGTLPVFATAAAFVPDPERNRDIDGLIVATTPWELAQGDDAIELQRSIERHWPERIDARSSLYAMGYDAWRLVPLLSARAEQAAQLRGLTGELVVDQRGRVLRSPVLARIENGLATPLAPPEAPDEEPAPSRQFGDAAAP